MHRPRRRAHRMQAALHAACLAAGTTAMMAWLVVSLILLSLAGGGWPSAGAGGGANRGGGVSAQSIPTPNLPPGPKCYKQCPGDDTPVTPRKALRVYVFVQPGCRGPMVAATQYSRDFCGWDYPGHLGGCQLSPQVGCAHTWSEDSGAKSLLLPPGSHVRTYRQCNILYHYDENTIKVIDEFHNVDAAEWRCFDATKAAGSLHVYALGHMPGSSWGWALIALLLVCGALYLGAGVLSQRRRGQRVVLTTRAGLLAAVPHPRFWAGLGGLVRDGVMLTRATISGRRPPTTCSSGRGSGGGGGSADPLLSDKRPSRSGSGTGGGGSRKSPKGKSKGARHQDKRSPKGARASVGGRPDDDEESPVGGSSGTDLKRAEGAGAAAASRQRLLREECDHSVHSSQARVKVLKVASSCEPHQ
eukprot:COSAG01_NODE_5263_length_4376_cov_3.153612_1_plen_415_part_00